MPVDPRMFAPADIAGLYQRGQQAYQQRQQYQNQQKLGDLLPKAVNGDTSAMEQIAHIDPRVFMQLNQQQREQANAELNDLAGAVRWADTPEKWQQVQQYYASHGHTEAMQYPFESRETVVMQLGKIGEYLKAGQGPDQPSSVREYEYAKAQGFDGSYMDFKNEFGSPIVQRNEDGTMTVIPRSAIGGGQSQRSGPRPGQVEDGYRFKGGNPADPNNWIKVNGGQTPQASGGFPSSGS